LLSGSLDTAELVSVAFFPPVVFAIAIALCWFFPAFTRKNRCWKTNR
jgi:hypothetical protein